MARSPNRVYLIRHAHTGQRGAEKRDLYRALSKRGFSEAEGLADGLELADISAVVSSPATRCVQTVELLARARSLKVIEHQDLFEDATVDEALSVMESYPDANVAVCSHGNLIPEILEMLVRRHKIKVRGRGCEKGRSGS